MVWLLLLQLLLDNLVFLARGGGGVAIVVFCKFDKLLLSTAAFLSALA